jgi:hypothetical protein
MIRRLLFVAEKYTRKKEKWRRERVNCQVIN